MDFYRNEDKLTDCNTGLSFNQVLDVNNTAAVSAELFSVGQFKQHYGKIDTSDEDTLIEALITAARQMCENYVGMNFVPRAVTAIINNLNGGTYLPCGPIGAISSMSDQEGNVIASDSYRITGNQFKQVQWPTYDWLSITYTGGFTLCPEQLVTAVKEQTLWLYDNRGKEGVGLAPNAQMILNPLKRPM